MRFADRKSSASTLLRRCHRLHEKAVGEEERSANIFHHNPTRNHPSLAADPKQCKLRGKVDRPVWTSHTMCSHDINSPRTETSIFDLQNDATVRRTVTTFVWPQTQFHENLHTNFVLQNLPIINRLWNVCGQMEVGALLTCGSGIRSINRTSLSVMKLLKKL